MALRVFMGFSELRLHVSSSVLQLGQVCVSWAALTDPDVSHDLGPA